MITKHRFGIMIASFFLAIFAGLTVAWVHFLYSPVISTDLGLRYNVRLGASYKTVVADLNNQQIVKHPYFFAVLFRLKGDTEQLKAGEYLFPKGSTPGTIIDQVVSGRGMVHHAFTIVPGTTFRQVRQALDDDRELQHTSQHLSDAAIMKRIGYPDLHPEGQFYPDTYYFVEGSPDLTLLKRAFVMMQKKLNNAWQGRSQNLPFKNPNEALTAASIIEKEAHLKEELPIIAGVLINRLNKNIKLQFDPTVIYGVGARYDGVIYKRDLTDKNPYNTYVHQGLPPTPISMPSMDAIEAVMHPDPNNYLYFVAKGDGVSHQFSETLAQHNMAVKAAKRVRPGFMNTALIKQYIFQILTKGQISIGI